MSWTLLVNPVFENQKPRPLAAACHDGTPFLTIRCNECGSDLHLHESQIADVPTDTAIAVRCPQCPAILEFWPGWFQVAFAQVRKEGWIADRGKD